MVGSSSSWRSLRWRRSGACCPPRRRHLRRQLHRRPVRDARRQPRAAGATKTFPATDDTVSRVARFSPARRRPQAQLLMESGSFDNTVAVTISVTPVAPPAVKPPNGTIEGNVYKYSAVNACGRRSSLPVRTCCSPSCCAGPSPFRRADHRSLQRHVVDPAHHAELGVWQHLSRDIDATRRVRRRRSGRHITVADGSCGAGIPGALIIGALGGLLVIAVAVLFTLDRRRSAVALT